MPPTAAIRPVCPQAPSDGDAIQYAGKGPRGIPKGMNTTIQNSMGQRKKGTAAP